MSSKKTGKATGTKPVTKTTDKTGRQSVKASENKTGTKPVAAKREKDQFGILAGTRKAEVALAYSKRGPDYATDKAIALGIQKSTVRSWIGQWKKRKLWVEPKPAKASKGMTSIKQAADTAADVAAKVAPEDTKKSSQDA